MNNLLDGSHPRNVGVEHEFDYARYTRAVDAILTSIDSRMLAEYGDAETGMLLVVDEQLRSALKLPAAIEALVHWSDGAESDPDDEVRLLDKGETEVLLAQSESAIAEAICRHCEKHPDDDRHPAHALYRLRSERRIRAVEEARR